MDSLNEEQWRILGDGAQMVLVLYGRGAQNAGGLIGTFGMMLVGIGHWGDGIAQTNRVVIVSFIR